MTADGFEIREGVFTPTFGGITGLVGAATGLAGLGTGFAGTSTGSTKGTLDPGNLSFTVGP